MVAEPIGKKKINFTVLQNWKEDSSDQSHGRIRMTAFNVLECRIVELAAGTK